MGVGSRIGSLLKCRGGVAMYFNLGGERFRRISIWRGGSSGWYFDLGGGLIQF